MELQCLKLELKNFEDKLLIFFEDKEKYYSVALDAQTLKILHWGLTTPEFIIEHLNLDWSITRLIKEFNDILFTYNNIHLEIFVNYERIIYNETTAYNEILLTADYEEISSIYYKDIIDAEIPSEIKWCNKHKDIINNLKEILQLDEEKASVYPFRLYDLIHNEQKFWLLFSIIMEAKDKKDNDSQNMCNYLNLLMSLVDEDIPTKEMIIDRLCELKHLIMVEKIVWKEKYTKHSDLLECDFEKHIIENFAQLFPEYRFIRNQVIVEYLGGRIDILAHDDKEDRPVIMELKVGKTNPKRQLYSYASHFDNPILVAVTTKECDNKHPKIIYKVIEI